MDVGNKTTVAVSWEGGEGFKAHLVSIRQNRYRPKEKLSTFSLANRKTSFCRYTQYVVTFFSSTGADCKRRNQETTLMVKYLDYI